GATDGGVYTGFATSTLNISSVNGLNGNQYSVVVTETTAPGCALVATPAVTLTVEALPTGSLSGTTSICAGSSTNLIFTLTGTGPYDVDYSDGTTTFTLNGIVNGATKSVSPGSTKTYTITKIKDNGTTGGCLGTSFGASATVTVTAYPTISQYPLAQTKCTGSGTSFSVTASGTSLSYQWFRGATLITGATDGGVYTGFATSTLNISSVNGLNGNQYSVVVTETTAPGCALVATPAVTLTVEALPTGSLSGTTSICAGSSTNLIFTLTGTGPYDVDYSDGTTTFTLNGIVNGATKSVSPGSTKTYTITKIKDNGTTGGCLGTSFGASATVTVTAYPTISQYPLAQTKCTGSGTSFSVTASGTSLSYQWFRGATLITGATDGGVYTGFATSTLNISSVNGLNGNQYSVVVTETTAPGCALVATPAVTLTVEALPTGSLSGTTSICAGSSTNLIFTLTGTGPYDVDYSDGTTTFTLNGIVNGATKSVSPGSTKTYTITKIKDNGTTGGCLGTSFGASATVTVTAYPTISQYPLAQTKCTGSGTSFSVTASGTSLSYQWFRGATLITGATDGGVYTGFATSTLNISSVNGLNGNQYSVVVTETTAPGCALVATPAVTLTVEALPTGSLSGTTSICAGSSTNLIFTLTGT